MRPVSKPRISTAPSRASMPVDVVDDASSGSSASATVSARRGRDRVRVDRADRPRDPGPRPSVRQSSSSGDGQLRRPVVPKGRSVYNKYYEAHAIAWLKGVRADAAPWKRTVLEAAISTTTRPLPHQQAPAAPAAHLITYTAPGFPMFQDNIGVQMTADIALHGLVASVDGGMAKPLFADRLAALTWLRLLIMVGRTDVPQSSLPTTISGCLPLVQPLTDQLVWTSVDGKWERPVVLHIRPNSKKSASGGKLRETVAKGAVEAFATHASVQDICLAARCALALADGAEEELPLGGVAAPGEGGGLVAAHLPTDIFSVLGSIVRDDDSDAESIGTASAVSELIGSDDEEHGVGAGDPSSASRTRFVCHIPLPFPPVGIPSFSPDGLIHPMVSQFPSILTALYMDPIRVSSEAWTQRLRERFSMGRAAFDRLSFDHFHEINAEPALSHMCGRGRAYSFRFKSFRAGLEAHIFKAAQADELSEVFRKVFEKPVDGATIPILIIFVYLDAAGRSINSSKVALLYLIPLCFKRPGSLRVLVPAACHIGRFAQAQAKAFWAWLAPEFDSLHHICFGGVRMEVKFIFGPDMAELWNSTTVRKGNIPWMASDIYGAQWFSGACSGYDDRTMHMSLTLRVKLPSDPLPRHNVPPTFIGTEMSFPYFQVPVHRLIHTIGKFLAELAACYFALGHHRVAFHLVDAFPRTPTWDPVPEAPVRLHKAKNAEADGVDDEEVSGGEEVAGEGGAAAGGGEGAATPTRKIAGSPRCKNVALFLMCHGVYATSEDRPTWSAECDPPVSRYRPNHRDVFDLLVETPVTLKDGTTTAAAWQKFVKFVTISALERRIPVGEEISEYRNLGFQCAEAWKMVCIRYRPWGPTTGGTLPNDPSKRTPDGTGPVTDTTWFRTKCMPSEREATIEAASAVEFDYPLCAIGPAGIDALDHGTKTFEELTAAEAHSFTEQAGDHFFTYLYNTIPAVSARVLKGRDNATAIWRSIVEIWAAGVPCPPPGSRRGQILQNSAYTDS